MFALKYIAAIIAIFSSLMFISCIVSDVFNNRWIADENKSTNNAGYRVIFAAIMSISWPLLFLI